MDEQGMAKLRPQVVASIERSSDEQLEEMAGGLTQHVRWLAANRETIEFRAPRWLNAMIVAVVAEQSRRDER